MTGHVLRRLIQRAIILLVIDPTTGHLAWPIPRYPSRNP